MYHSITPKDRPPIDRWEVSVNKFQDQIHLLKSEGWTTVCVRDLMHADSLPPRTVVITFDDGYADNFENAFKVLAKYGMRATWFIVSQRVGKQQSWLDSSQIREMAALGMEIGAHTRTHARLIELGVKKIEEEVRGSKSDLEDVLGLPVTSFAYPFGLFNDECVEAVRESRFQAACTTRTGWFGSETDLLRVRRVAVFSHDSLSAFARKIVFATSNVSWKKMAEYTADRIKSRLLRR
jgi:peptidoglycan/xylan/chitin deacetylase (PgdA/CDA1 family)